MAKAPKFTPAPGFDEAPQTAFEGEPLSGSVSDWVRQLEAQAEASTVETQREIASKAGKHRKKVEIAARNSTARPLRDDEAFDGPSAPAKKPGKAKSPESTSSRSARGTSMGGSSDPKTAPPPA